MSYRLKIKEPLAEGIQRIVFEQIEIAEGELRGNADAAAAVHNTRRALKRLRAVLRLVRPGLDDAVYRRESQRFAEIGRMLAGTRDRHVMRQTLKALANEVAFPAALVPAFDALLAHTPATASETSDLREKAANRFAAGRKAMAGDILAGLEPAHLFEGVERAYRKGRRLHRQCQAPEAVDEDFHALRKCVQQHWRHMQVLSRAWPEALSARADEAKAISQLLGEDHDLHVLRSFALAHAEALPADGLTALRHTIDAAQAARRAHARLHGDRLYAERARDLSERLRRYWTAAQGLAALQTHPEAESAPAASPKPQPLKPRVRRPPAAKRAKAAPARAPRATPRRNA